MVGIEPREVTVGMAGVGTGLTFEEVATVGFEDDTAACVVIAVDEELPPT